MFTEIKKLHEMLEEANIPHDYEKRLYGWSVSYPKNEDFICDAVTAKDPINDRMFKSLGYDEGLIEIQGLLTPEEEKTGAEDPYFGTVHGVAGWLTANDVFNRIKTDWETRKEN